MDQDKEKLKFLLQHWAEHNESHKDNFVKWVRKAKMMGLDSTAENLAKAVDATNESIKYLQKALKEFE